MHLALPLVLAAGMAAAGSDAPSPRAVAEYYARRLLGSALGELRYHRTSANPDGSPQAHLYVAESADGDRAITLGVAPDSDSFPLLFYYFDHPSDRWPARDPAEGSGTRPQLDPLARERAAAAWARFEAALTLPGAKDDPVEVVIPGVPIYLWYMNCALISETMVLAYWNDHGYEGLVPGGTSATGCPWAITEELCWTEWTGSRVATYAGAREFGNSVSFLQANIPITPWEEYRGAIDTHGMPLNVSWKGVPYGAHATVGVGYREADGQRFLILHDTWVSRPAYVNYDQYQGSLAGMRRDYPDPAQPAQARPHAPARKTGLVLEPMTYAFSPALDPARYSYHCLEAADIDGDGKPDLLVGNFSLVAGDALRLYLQRDGGFVFDTRFRPVLTPYDCMQAAKACDFDGDGDLDVAATGYWAYVRVFVNEGGTLLSSGIVVDDKGRGFTDLAWGDFDGDGDPDLAASTLTGKVRLYRNEAGTSFAPAGEIGSGLQYMQVAFAELTGDSYPELLACDRNRSVVGFSNDGGAITGSRFFEPAAGHGALTFDVADVDRDGFLEIVTIDDGKLVLFENEGGVLAGQSTPIAAGHELFPRDLRLSDLDGDGFPELAVASFNRLNAVVRNERGSFAAEPLWASSSVEPSVRVSAFDLEGDGTREIAFLKFRGGRLDFFRATLETAPFRRGDVNADGSIDLSDAAFTLLALFDGPRELPCEKSADANDSGAVNVADAITLLGYLFASGAHPPEPFAACGSDPTKDPLGCLAHDPCAAAE